MNGKLWQFAAVAGSSVVEKDEGGYNESRVGRARQGNVKL